MNTAWLVFSSDLKMEPLNLYPMYDTRTLGHPVYFKKTSAAPFGNRSPQLGGAWVCSWADLKNLQGGAGPPHQTQTRWSEKEKFLSLSAPQVQAPHFGRLLCWMGVAGYSRNHSGFRLLWLLLLISLPSGPICGPRLHFFPSRLSGVICLGCFVQ